MAAKTGVSILVKIGTKTLGGQRNATLNRGTNMADSTTKSSGGWEEGLPTTRNWGVECDALYLSDDSAYADLKTAWRNSTPVNVVVDDNGAKESGQAYITDFPLEAPHDDVATIAVTLQGTGALTAS